MPYFSMIQNHTLHLRDLHLNSKIIKAFASYIDAQTALFKKKLAMEAKDVDIYEDEADEDFKQLRELSAGQVMIETLSVDECRLKDEDLAILLKSIAG